jgi:ABC-type lipoprotein export system ATPase subunit
MTDTTPTENSYPKGSEWRKWDLHVHTPASFYFNGTKKLCDMSAEEKTAEIKNFIDIVNISDVAVFCLMDYWTFDWYLELQEYVTTKPYELKKTVFPGMELRIESPTDYRLNIHVILSDKLSKQELVDFKSELYILSIDKKLSDDALIRFAKSLDESKAAKHGYANPDTLNDDKLLQLGSQTAEITKESLGKAFNQIPIDTGYVILPYDTSDGLLNLNWEDHPHADNYFMQSSQIFETRDQRNIDLISGIKTPENEKFFENFYKTLGNQAKPCISGSDAHKYSDYGKYPSNRITWIKADPTFEGLKQIIFEPKERIRIQEANPDTDFDNPLFTSIQIIEETKILDDINSELKFSKTELPLNRGMVSIIGGRGQGKSMLINYLGHGFEKEINQKLQSKILLNDNFQVEWKQGSEAAIKTYTLGNQKELPFTFIYQSKIKEIADDNEVLKKEIIDILNGAGFQKPVSKIDEFQVKETVQKYWNIKEWLDKVDDTGKKLNDKETIRKKIASTKEIIELVSEGSNKFLLESFVQGIEIINNKKEENLKLRKLRDKLISFRDTLNEDLFIYDNIPPIDTTAQQKRIAVLYKRNLEEIHRAESDNKKIKENDFKDFKGDLSQLLSNLTNYQREITELEEQLKTIDENLTELEATKKLLNEIIAEQLNVLAEEASAISETWKRRIFDNPERGKSENELIKKILADKNINIEGTIFFNSNAFYFAAERLIDGRSLKPKSKEKIFELLQLGTATTANDVLNYTVEKLEGIKEESNGCFYIGSENDIFKIFIDPTIKNRYVQVVANITVDGKNLNELSAGQKGTVYLCLKLATQLFSGPIIFDQPEDDLDNDFITNQLIDLFKEIKKYRQVIIVSHNANLVVNADSEQVIIANNTDEKLSYESGSLENENINHDICRILEGGQRAFEKRRDKYMYNKK